MSECGSNSSLTDVLVENDCHIDPDYIQLTCSLVYHGNKPPSLTWHHSSMNDISHHSFHDTMPSSIFSHQSTTANSSVVINTLTLTSNIRLNGTHFICSVDETEAGEQSYGCATRTISVICE